MLTTSRKEVFTEHHDTFANRSAAAVDTKMMGRDSYAINTDAKKSNVSAFDGSYFADSEREIAVKLFGSDVAVEEYNIEESDTENYTNPDLMPTGVTMESRSGKVKLSSQPTVVENAQKAYVNIRGLTQKGKVAVVAYAALVLALVLLITLTAVAVNASVASIATLQTEINKTIEDINAMYVDVEENADLYAQELGLVPAENATTAYYTPVSTREEITYNVSENWFDDLCEWVSSIFGG